MFSVFPNFHIEGPTPCAMVTTMFSLNFLPGTQNADWVGIPSTGRSFSTRVTVLFEFEQDQLVRERCYMDFGDIARQLRATN
jgi:predicted ester cyclase